MKNARSLMHLQQKGHGRGKNLSFRIYQQKFAKLKSKKIKEKQEFKNSKKPKMGNIHVMIIQEGEESKRNNI